MANKTASQYFSWSAWVPTWTNVTIGNATVTARYIQIGKFVFFQMTVVWGNTTSASGAQFFSLPVTAGSSYQWFTGTAAFYDSSTGKVWTGSPNYNSTSTMGCQYMTISGTDILIGAVVNASAPFVWTTSDTLTVEGFYEAA